MSWQNWHWGCGWNRWRLGDCWSLSFGSVRGWRWCSRGKLRRRRCGRKCKRRRSLSNGFLCYYWLRRSRCWRWGLEFLFLAPSSTFWRRRGNGELFILCYDWRSRRCSNGNGLLHAYQFIRSGRRRRAGAEAGYGNRTALGYRRFLLVLCVALFNLLAFWSLK